MTASLPQVSMQHHSELERHLDEMPAVGDLVGAAPADDLRPRVGESVAFLNDLLLPHMEAAEQTLYPELERMLQNRHSMSPMRREHGEIRELIEELGRLQVTLEAGPLHMRESIALRRVIFRLYAMLKVHLAEEQLYLGVLEHGVSPEAADRLAAAMENSWAIAF
ncbi:MAG: hemerythrin domain-containing protein [Chloroflexota bacterium]|jgi:hemerythrin-like domain-containing protein|nr:hemerythrin domain-containing protein [Chloroflexota bacterium]MDH5242709.1 hemerythrin domain-containing protein [Chloroflexota bacterium]